MPNLSIKEIVAARKAEQEAKKEVKAEPIPDVPKPRKQQEQR